MKPSWICHPHSISLSVHKWARTSYSLPICLDCVLTLNSILNVLPFIMQIAKWQPIESQSDTDWEGDLFEWPEKTFFDWCPLSILSRRSIFELLNHTTCRNVMSSWNWNFVGSTSVSGNPLLNVTHPCFLCHWNQYTALNKMVNTTDWILKQAIRAVIWFKTIAVLCCVREIQFLLLKFSRIA